FESFARAPIERLEEIRVGALEQRMEADLALGHHTQLIPELEQLVIDHPLRERLRAQLMLALYGSGRQADALEVYRDSRRALVEACGIEPGPTLRQLEHQILAQDPSLKPVAPQRPTSPNEAPQQTVLAVPQDEAGIARLLTLGEPLASLPGTELIVARLVKNE